MDNSSLHGGRAGDRIDHRAELDEGASGRGARRPVEWGRRAVRQSPELAGHWRVLALSAAMLDHAEEARAAVATARKLHPEYSVAWVESDSPLVHAADRARYCDILRAVGLPEA